jgi:hypothetical protein
MWKHSEKLSVHVLCDGIRLAISNVLSGEDCNYSSLPIRVALEANVGHWTGDTDTRLLRIGTGQSY